MPPAQGGGLFRRVEVERGFYKHSSRGPLFSGTRLDHESLTTCMTMRIIPNVEPNTVPIALPDPGRINAVVRPPAIAFSYPRERMSLVVTSQCTSFTCVMRVERIHSAHPGHDRPLSRVTVGCACHLRHRADAQVRMNVNDAEMKVVGQILFVHCGSRVHAHPGVTHDL